MARNKGRPRSMEQRLADLDEALTDAERFVLPLDIDDFLDDRKARGLARDVLNRVRTAVSKLDRKTMGTMPEFVPAEIAELRNLAIYDYGVDADELVYRTLQNSVPNWRRGVDRAVHGAGPDGELPTTVPTGADGSLQQARPVPLCGQHMPRAGKPCVLARGHAGHHRSILP